MLKKFLGITLTILLCLPTSAALANSNVNSSSKEFTISSKTLNDSANKNSNYKKLLNDKNVVTQNKSKDLLESQKVADCTIQKDTPIKSNVNKTLLSSLQKSTNLNNSLLMSKSVVAKETTSSSVDVNTDAKPIADLKYVIMNPDSIKNGQITTDTQIAWLWSYNGENYTYDPNGYAITNMSLDGIPSISDSILGSLTGNIGFATQFKTPGEYIMKFKCMNDHNVWSDEWSISIPVEPVGNNTRPECTINYSTASGDTDTQFVFSWANSTDKDANDSIKDAQGLVIKDNQSYPLSKYITYQEQSLCAAKFTDPGNYTLMFRVSDTNNAWSNWVVLNITVKTALPKTSTPGNLSLSDVWNRICSNSKNNTSQEAFQRSIPESSQYFTSAVDSLGNVHYYYLLQLEDKYKSTSTNYLTQFPTYLIYNNDFVTSNQYHNGYYGTWFPDGSLSFKDGVMSANLGFKKYSWVDFNDYKRLHIFDFNAVKDYTVEYFDGVSTKHPYFVCYNMVNNSRIVYGQSNWFSDGSGNSFLSRIDRKTGNIIRNNDIIFGDNSEVANGKMIDNVNYQFYSSKIGCLYTINADTLSIVSKTPGTLQNGKFVAKVN
ncbi:hypothetical protein [Clostridium saccharoperbutylacetonicum]|uniref:PKD domain-containing protein n=2 Tax=Clostridium TaxID=1485 RepID=M1MD66_9CLOT|nr:hypothetical protein [Clostridium saccharoperbutylacetonicum]AGF54333.1 hypothetical protein Cspa_c05390 [Clostridium saccharoperbutylacetonicum N1-4(HMT)]AQR93251.1 hypothetical protein CLSAP_05450 [Clostridium saccharoperbutylacetonicum]NRT59151.1 hypothetical protein [Clostridium saccharoperbutylacetonicum]NSB28340.1 hypothetical protein [Clostridium saccharoperbutylacetonicum]NSB34668.1 hypothetical protein [Clostridium saccharoperbutylacetonicum]